MKNFVRMAALAVVVTAATPAFAQTASVPAGTEPVGRARIIKPLQLEAVSDLNFGDITVEDAGVATVNGTTGAAISSEGFGRPLTSGWPLTVTSAR